ncbi:unnamed protein product [Clavelina lepadiformis]|uniref:Maltase n=1 Tax=Clavelina lepadiformis TaxID=159417 RepID=A0ABP0GB81_CLALP
MRFICFVGVFVSVCGLSTAYTAASCPSTISEWDRVDCYPEAGSNEQACIGKGCMWCETNQQGPPWCFYDTPTATTAPPGEECGSCSCVNKVDCYPEPGSSEAGCYSRGCLWCPSNVNGEPWCIQSDGTSSTSAPPSGSCPTTKLDCYSDPGSNEQGCYDRGCLWCPAEGTNDPWCVFPEGVTAPPSSGGCPATIPESQRIDCWPGGGATQAGCESAGCIWCESSQNDVPWCFFNTTNLPEGIDDAERVNCIPEGGFSPTTCQERGCAFANVNSPDAPMCYYSNDNYGYTMVGDAVATYNGYRVTLQKISSGSMFGDDVDTVTLDVNFDTSSRLRLKFFDEQNDRFEVPLDIKGADPTPPSDPLYDVMFFNEPSFYFQVVRKSTGTILLDTSLGGFTFSNQFLQIATRLPSTTMYGFGEHEHQTLAHNFNWESFGMYARDQPPDPGANLYGVHPFYVTIEDDNNAHGVLFLNSNAQDVTLTPAPGLVYRTIGGILDMYVFLGPEPNSVIEQYTSAIGTTFLPPYWSLGFQLCRYGYGSLDTVKETVARMDAYDIPLVSCDIIVTCDKITRHH